MMHGCRITTITMTFLLVCGGFLWSGKSSAATYLYEIRAKLPEAKGIKCVYQKMDSKETANPGDDAVAASGTLVNTQSTFINFETYAGDPPGPGSAEFFGAQYLKRYFGLIPGSNPPGDYEYFGSPYYLACLMVPLEGSGIVNNVSFQYIDITNPYVSPIVNPNPWANVPEKTLGNHMTLTISAAYPNLAQNPNEDRKSVV